jgi:hypothetical protein
MASVQDHVHVLVAEDLQYLEHEHAIHHLLNGERAAI